MNTGADQYITYAHSSVFKSVTWKTLLKNGTYNNIKCNANDNKHANTTHLFDNPTVNSHDLAAVTRISLYHRMHTYYKDQGQFRCVPRPKPHARPRIWPIIYRSHCASSIASYSSTEACNQGKSLQDVLKEGSPSEHPRCTSWQSSSPWHVQLYH